MMCNTLDPEVGRSGANLVAPFWRSLSVLTITRRATFSAAHRLFRPDWDDQRNVDIFGRCANPGGHGHNYVLEVTVGGELDPETGMIADLKWVKEIVDRYVIDHVDHRSLNSDVEFLHGVIPTAENLARIFWERLAGPISERARLVRVQVQETENNAAMFEAP
jgi:6-pyruvoyltetrahydropterin/6-carboxytetrahydropterin synthase